MKSFKELNTELEEGKDSLPPEMKEFLEKQLKAKIRQTGTDPKDRNEVTKLMKANIESWVKLWIHLGN
jgi:hypothetical protein